MDDHLKHLEIIAKRLDEYRLQINMKKSEFLKKSVLYCGYLVENGHVKIDPEKVRIVRSWPVPTNSSAVRSFLGFLGYYRKFIKDFGTMAAPLHAISGMKSVWIWSSLEQNSFESLRNAMLKDPVLVCPNDKFTFHIWPDASPWAVGGVLTQDHGNGHQPIAYEYHKLSKAELNYPHHEKEILAMLYCLRKWRYYFEGRKFVVHSDNTTVVRMSTVKDPHRRLQRCIQEYQYWSPDIIYEPGTTNPADGPSRIVLDGKNESDDEDLLSDFDPFGPLPTDLAVNALRVEEWNLEIDPVNDWPLVVAYFLEFGEWPAELQSGLKARCTRELVNFEIHHDLFRVSADLRPVAPSALPFERWGMDFIQNLQPTKRGNRHIITAIDYATRWVVCRAVKKMDSDTVADFLYHDIMINFGAPYEIFSDRGSSLLSESIRSYEKLQRIKHKASTPYHPQTNGMVERMHATLRSVIAKLGDGQPDRWDEFLPQAVFSLRVRTHAVTKKSPFYLLFGVQPRLPTDTNPLRTSMIPLDELEEMEEKHEFIARVFDELGYDRAAAYHNSEAQAVRMNKYYDIKKKTKGSYYDINDMVKLKNFGKSKFEFSWKGPYHVVGFGIVPSTYYLMDSNGKRIDYTVAQDNLAPWLAPLGSNQDFAYNPTLEEIDPAVPLAEYRSCEGRTERYDKLTKRIGIPIRLPTNDR